MKKILIALLFVSTQAKRLSLRDDDVSEVDSVACAQNEEFDYDGPGQQYELRKELKKSESDELKKLEKEKAKILADLAKAKKEAKQKARDAIEDPSGFRKLQQQLEKERIGNGFLNEVEQAEADAAALVQLRSSY